MPSPTTKSWERGAKMVKNTDSGNLYLERIRDLHDPSMHVKTIEDELKGTMSKALGNQGHKLMGFISRMNEERKKYNKIMADNDSQENKETELALGLTQSVKVLLVTNVQNHNMLRKEAVTARWELLVHRQAVGFITSNQKFVNENFPIPPLLNLPGKAEDWVGIQKDQESHAQTKCQQVAKEAVTRNFGDQLDWWERIGRWR
eukprot:scaffold3524_cov279-Chaetoceros_neogracile.AAC.7